MKKIITISTAFLFPFKTTILAALAFLVSSFLCFYYVLNDVLNTKCQCGGRMEDWDDKKSFCLKCGKVDK